MIVVDVINTIHCLTDLKSMASADIEGAISQTAHLVRSKYKSGKIKLVVDGFPKNLRGLPSHCSVQYSRNLEADDVIVRLINKQTNMQFTLISADRGIVRRLMGSVKVVHPSSLSAGRRKPQLKSNQSVSRMENPTVSEIEVQEMLKLFGDQEKGHE